MKDVVFVGGSGEDLRSFPVVARQRAGYQLYLVQMGFHPTDWKPMLSICPGCRRSVSGRTETPTASSMWRASGMPYVLHCFQKKSRQTTKADIDRARQRYRQVVDRLRAKEQP